MENYKRSIGINLIGFTLLASNIILMRFFYMTWMYGTVEAVEKLLLWLSAVAVFPLDFFNSYLSHDWVVQTVWIFMMMVCGTGILLLNRLARVVFIVLCVIHITILANLIFFRAGSHFYLADYIFKIYFNLLPVGIYVTFLTIPEVRHEFKTVELEKIKFRMWFARIATRPVGRPTAEGHYNLGLAYSRMERYEDAIDALEKAIAVNPQNEHYHYHLGEIYLKQKKYHEAIKKFRQAIKLNMVYKEAYYNLGMAQQKIGCDKEAVAAFERFLRFYPDHVAVLKRIAASHISLHQYQEAKETLEKSLRKNPGDANAYYKLGCIDSQHLQDYERARENFRKALKLNQAVTDAHFQLGVVSIHLQRYKDAVREFKEVLRVYPDHKEAHYRLGFSYALLKDFDSARREYRYLQDIDTDLAQNLLLMIQ